MKSWNVALFNEADELALKKEYVESKGMILFRPSSSC
jgi:hypothetical protein